ncbi:Hypothetical predicted protein [Mytilus galloprovincialis]|uniref:Uncharacterized protein n=1 Tax=Mytilus galloprovincialis TaxID=29158 RepID=A0A8B6CU46_MYTGA|nr:Hypothetical predicted protein [Mytilus galloprovincialis]
MGATCGKKCNSDRKQQRKEIALIRFVQRLRNIFNKNRVVPFSEPGSRSVSSVILKIKYQMVLNKPCIDLNPTPLLDNVEFNNDDLPSASENPNLVRDIQGKGGETKETKEKETISAINTYYEKFEKDVDVLLSGTNDTQDRARRPKAAKGEH